LNSDINKCRAQKRRISSSLSGEEDVPMPAKRRLFEKDEEENAEAEVDKENEKPAIHVRPIRNSFKKYASLANMDVSGEEESDEDEEETDESDGEEEEKKNGNEEEKEESREDEESSGEDGEESEKEDEEEESDEDEEDSDENEEDSDEDEEDSDENEEESGEDEEEEDDQSKDWKRVNRFFDFEAKCR
jgi:cobalamin biosynthesis protein CobT